jgi:hypothetical protein
MSASEPASARDTYDTHEPSSPIKMIGRRPMRSDQRPQIGANTNCISEYTVLSMPTVKASAP